MSRILLQDMLDDIRFDPLPANWNTFDIRIDLIRHLPKYLMLAQLCWHDCDGMT